MFGYISHYEGMETGDIVARVVEGRVNKVNVVQVDDEGNTKKGAGEVQPEIILRELPFKVRSGALRNVKQLLAIDYMMRCVYLGKLLGGN